MTPAQIGASAIVSADSLTLSEIAALTAKPGAADTLTVAESQTVTATGGAPNSWFAENFDTYTSTANMLSDPRGVYSLGEDVNTGQMVLDKTVGYTTYGLTQSMRYDYVATGDSSGPGDYQVTRNLWFPNTVTDVWVESVERGSATFTVDAWPGYAGQRAWKHFFGRINGASGRFSTGSIGRWVSEYPPGGQELDTGTYAQTWDPGDNAWHKFRYHWKIGGSGILQIWMDGVKMVDTGSVSVSGTNIYGVSIGQTFNNGPIQTMSYWWGAINVYNTNPGW